MELPPSSLSLFDAETPPSVQSGDYRPLAARIRPQTLDDFVGQEHVLGPGTPLRRAIEQDTVPSLILWGPPGSGKTTLAWIIAQTTRSHFVPLSAVSSGVAQLRSIVEEAIARRQRTRQRTIVFVDEIHRWNKSQQDAVLPYVEDGTIVLIGATTENPSFEVNAALLSRSQVVVLRALERVHLQRILDRALCHQEGLATFNVVLTDEACAYLLTFANGDARRMLNTLELAAHTTLPNAEGKRVLDRAAIEHATQKRWLHYDRAGEEHYTIISALHKSIRDSDPDGSLYWLGRMLEAGEDPLYIARRLIRIATEDIGLADPHALPLCVAAQQAVHFVGMPEGNLALAEAVVYLALAPKSNALYTAYTAVQQDIEQTMNQPVPLHLRNAPTPLTKQLGYGTGYQYAHDYENALVEQEHLPPPLQGRRYWCPSDRGFEAELRKRMEEWEKLRRQSRPLSPPP
ncbi:MAG: replication-associated recombination protein A [Bacteroidota bacterium]|nr:replication-associated recombination protein A [Candidatus Kapabacteria bacterium]MCS7302777.1 replication-associated recombination protein A [Candidatus Kapabacteria bacterium]MDW8075464.1 replication-associated recombination protein A [Bacteroidota bacterium]MDW8272321.1 replication-associated recombination protein A [Bacteroidota bacterium]